MIEPNNNAKNIEDNIKSENVSDPIEERIEEIEKKDDDLQNNQNKIDHEQFRAKMIKLFAIVFIGLVVILLISFISSLFSHKDYTYSSVEQIMKDAAISYFNDHKSKLPKSSDNIVEISSDVLTDEKYMKDLDKYLPNKSCSGKVNATMVSKNNYDYTSYLSCSNYDTIELYKKILQSNIVSDGFGLYSLNGEYVYRGTKINNYVKFDDSSTLWRIVKVTSNNEVVLIQSDVTINQFSWDTRYNTVQEENSGINIYKNSSIVDILDLLYTNKINSSSNDYYYDNENKLLTKNDRSKLVEFSSCVAPRFLTDTSKDGSSDCQVTYDTKISLLSSYDFLNASLDSNCIETDSPSCQNYNYLAISKSFWLANGESDKSEKVYSISSNNSIYASDASDELNIRAVVHLGDTAMLEKGKGTQSNPYVIH